MTNQEMVYLIAFFVLIVCAVTDWLSYKIWVPVVLCPAPVMLFLISRSHVSLWKSILASGIVVASFLLFCFVTKEQIGKGDAILLGIATLGMDLWQIFAFLFLSFALAGIFGVFIMVVRKKGRKYKIPFAPFLLAGYILTIGLGYL